MSGYELALNGGWVSGDGAHEGVYVDNAGNVGIGTSTPQEKFQVSGGAARLDYLTFDPSYNHMVWNAERSGSNWVYIGNTFASMIKQGEANGGIIVKVAGTGSAGSAISFSDVMHIDSNARIGIGVLNPD